MALKFSFLKMKKQLAAYLCLFIAVSFSCSREIEIDFPVHDSKPVVNSFIGTDSLIKVHVKTSVPVLDPDTVFPDNASVLLFKDGLPVDTLGFSGNRYISAYRGESGGQHKVSVLIPGYDTVSATTTVPQKVKIKNIVHDHDILIDQDRIHYSQLRFTIEDTDPADNYYEFDIIERYSSGWSSENTTNGFTWVDNNVDPVLEDEGLLGCNPPTFVFTDRLFNGSDYTMTVNYTSPNNDTKVYDVILIFNSVSSDYYYYKRKLAIYKGALDSEIFFGGPGPVEMYSNINGGYGIFASYTSERFVINVNEAE